MAPSYTLEVNHFYGEKNGLHEEMIQKVRGHSQRPGAETASQIFTPRKPASFRELSGRQAGLHFRKALGVPLASRVKSARDWISLETTKFVLTRMLRFVTRSIVSYWTVPGPRIVMIYEGLFHDTKIIQI